jgi:hypothetical protein
MTTLDDIFGNNDDSNDKPDLLDSLQTTPSESVAEQTDSDVLRPEHVEGTNLADYIDAMRKGTAFLFSGKGYKVFKTLLRQENYKAAPTELDGEAWLRAVWTAEGQPDIQVQYKHPLYTNSTGYEVRGKRVTINAW